MRLCNKGFMQECTMKSKGSANKANVFVYEQGKRTGI